MARVLNQVKPKFGGQISTFSFFGHYTTIKVLGWLQLKILMERLKNCSINIDDIKSIVDIF